MTPTTTLTTNFTLSDAIETTKTYYLTSESVRGYCDELTALRQAIYKALNTEQYEYPIYSFSYGVRLDDLIGKDAVYVESELQRRIEECLLQDERIQSLDNFEFTHTEDNLLCTFDVVSIYGSLTVTQEVMT